MGKRITRDFGDLPVFVRQALLTGVEELRDDEVVELVVTGLKPPRETSAPQTDDYDDFSVVGC